MSLLQMSFAGAIMIITIVVIRALAINKLPKKTFLILWGIVLLRLLIPFSLPSMFSAYSLVGQSTPIMESVRNTPLASFIPTSQLQVEQITTTPSTAAHTTADIFIPVWTIIWGVGALACALFFAISYIKCCREFQASLPIDTDFANRWLSNHQIHRKITIRQSSDITAPLTYGMFQPIILMPKTTDWNNETSLEYVLAHEYIHIRRFDAVTKLIMITALCIHWFNPFVWVMYILFNRDIELSCDEAVVRLFGENTKFSYALTLISMEEAKSGLTPLCNSFSKNAIEERITAIMKIKKTSLLAILAAGVLVISVATAFATTAIAKQKELEAIPNTPFIDEYADTTSQSEQSERERREYPNATVEDYQSLLALKTTDYQQMFVADFNEALLDWASSDYDRTQRIQLDAAHGDYQVDLGKNEIAFVELTMTLSGEENHQMTKSLQTGNPEEDPWFGGKQVYTVSDDTYNPEWASPAYCNLWYQFSYHISDKYSLTVGERDSSIGGFVNTMNKFMNETSVEDLLLLTEEKVISYMKDVAAEYSNDQILITIHEKQVQYETMDERNLQ